MLSNVPLFRIADAQLLVLYGVLSWMFINVYQFWGLCSVILSTKRWELALLGSTTLLLWITRVPSELFWAKKRTKGNKKRRTSPFPSQLSCYSVSFFRFLFSGRLLSPQPVFAGKGAKPVGSWQSWYQSSGRVLKCILEFLAVLKGNPQSYKLQAYGISSKLGIHSGPANPG